MAQHTRSPTPKIAGYFHEPHQTVPTGEVAAGIAHRVRAKGFNGDGSLHRAVVLLCRCPSHVEEPRPDGLGNGIRDADVFSTRWIVGTNDAVDDRGAATARRHHRSDTGHDNQSGPGSLPHDQGGHIDVDAVSPRVVPGWSRSLPAVVTSRA
jgi:hypothetical protein